MTGTSSSLSAIDSLTVDVLSDDVSDAYVVKVVGTDRWRALFDVPVDGKQPIDLRCYLKLGDRTLSETWIYQYFA